MFIKVVKSKENPEDDTMSLSEYIGFLEKRKEELGDCRVRIAVASFSGRDMTILLEQLPEEDNA